MSQRSNSQPPSQETYRRNDGTAFCGERKVCDCFTFPFTSGFPSRGTHRGKPATFSWRTNPVSIATKRGDGGQTGLAGGIRVSKGSLRVEAYGTIDELNSALGLARAISADEDLKRRAKEIQRELFRVGSALATPPESRKGQVPITEEMVEGLTTQVHELEAIDGLLLDWSIPGEQADGAAFDLARTICRRAERNIVRLMEAGEAVEPTILAYVNRLSDLLWLFARKAELTKQVNSALRELNGKQGPRWSRAW